MRGIEAAFFGMLAKEPELRTSKSGKPWTSISVGVEIGDVDDSGAAKLTWIRVAVFGDAAVKLAGAGKGARLYVEGSLTLNTWNDAHGECRTGLNVAAWKAEKVGRDAIGRQRPPWERGQGYASAGRGVIPSPADCIVTPEERAQQDERTRQEYSPSYRGRTCRAQTPRCRWPRRFRASRRRCNSVLR